MSCLYSTACVYALTALNLAVYAIPLVIVAYVFIKWVIKDPRPCGRIHRTRFMEFLTSAQSIHSLTRAEMSGGNNNPSFAIADRLALMVNCVGPSMGKSAGFVPFSILSTYFAAP
jgi:hypothetical protein